MASHPNYEDCEIWLSSTDPYTDVFIAVEFCRDYTENTELETIMHDYAENNNYPCEWYRVMSPYGRSIHFGASVISHSQGINVSAGVDCLHFDEKWGNIETTVAQAGSEYKIWIYHLPQHSDTLVTLDNIHQFGILVGSGTIPKPILQE